MSSTENKSGKTQMSIRSVCDYPVIKNYISDRNRQKSLEHAQNCLDCMERLVAAETWLATRRGESALEASKISSDKMLACIDRYRIAANEDNLESFMERDRDYKKIRKSDSDYAAFRDLLNALQLTQPFKETPEYLKKIVANRLQHTRENSDSNGIVILLKDGVRLLSGALENIMIMPDISQSVATRSALASERASDAGALQFMFGQGDSGNVYYQVVQDSPETAMLTIRLDNFPALPKFVNLKKDNRLLHSFAMRDNTAYFSQLTSGDYTIELKDYAGRIIRRMDVQVVQPEGL